MRALGQMLLLAIAGPALGLAANAFSPRPAVLREPVRSAAEEGAGSCSLPGAKPPAQARRIGVEEAKALCAKCGAAFVDARGGAAYAAGHIPDAVHLPPAGHATEKGAIEHLRTFPMVIVYDGDYSCAVADDVAHRLSQAGLSDVRVLTGAWPAWNMAGGPGVSGTCAGCAEGGPP